jgi:hypothetical protein
VSPRPSKFGADPSVTYISIYCAGDVFATDAGEVAQSHQDEPWFIASFLPRWDASVGESGALIWLESTDYWRDHRPIMELRSGPHSDGAAGHLVEDRYVSAADWRKDPGIFENGDSRGRYNFRCGTCGYARVWKAPEVEAAFQKLVDVGVSEISLRALGTMLR